MPQSNKDRFESRLDTLQYSGTPEHLRDAAIFVHDTLDLAEIIAGSVTNLPPEEVPAELILGIYDRIKRKQEELKFKEEFPTSQLPN